MWGMKCNQLLRRRPARRRACSLTPATTTKRNTPTHHNYYHECTRRKSFLGQIKDFADEDSDYEREIYGKILFRLYASIPKKKTSKGMMEGDYKPNKGKADESFTFVSFLKFMCTEHGNMLSFVIFLPLIVMAIYISLVEDSPLYT